MQIAQARTPTTVLLVGITVGAMCFGGTIAYAGDLQADSTRAEISTFEGDLGEILASVDDQHGVSAEAGSLEEFDETSFDSDDESETSIEIEDSGEITFSAAGNPGFQVEFVDASGPLTRTGRDEPLAYEVGEGAVLVPQINDRHFRGIFVLDSTAAPTDFTMIISGDESVRLQPAPDGGVVFTDGSGAPVGGFLAPWAKTAQNVEVPTHFEIEGKTVRQVVDVSRLSEDDFPVVADPATYVNYTTNSVINIKNLGTVTKWKYLNACTAAKNKSCNIGTTYTASSSIQTALSISTKFVGSSIGITAGSSIAIHVSCSVKGPGKVTLYASATKKTYQVRTVRTYGVPPQLKRDTRTSGTLTAYKPNGKYVCS